MLNYITARAIVEEAHRAFSACDIEAVLRIYTDDFSFKRNAEDFVGPPLIIKGTEAMRTFLVDLIGKAEIMSIVDSFDFHSGIGRARASYFLKDRETGVTHTSKLRQLVTFRNMQIAEMEVYHDRASFSAFLRLIETSNLSSAPKRPTS